MRSSASIHGHPIHPMLIVYPFAFLTGAFGFGLAAAMRRSSDLLTASDRLIPAGIAAGLVAALPGAIDYVNTVPPKSSGNTRATQHALLNVASLGLFTASWLMRRRAMRTTPLVFQAIGSVTMSMAGWLGGTLVYRNQIAVDHRYADAGKWRETRTIDEPHALVEAAVDLETNQMKLVHAGHERVAVGRTERGVVAFQDRCTHKGGPLSDGVLMRGCVQCPWHGSQFDVHTGEVKSGPAEERIRTFDTGNESKPLAAGWP